MARAGDLLFGPLLQAARSHASGMARERQVAENRRRYEEGLRRQQEQFDYRKLQDLKRERDTVESQVYGLSDLELDGPLGRSLADRLDSLNKKIGDRRDLPEVEAFAPRAVDKGRHESAVGALDKFLQQRKRADEPMMGPPSGLAQHWTERLRVPDAVAEGGEEAARLAIRQQQAIDTLRMPHIRRRLASIEEQSRQRKAKEALAESQKKGAALVEGALRKRVDRERGLYEEALRASEEEAAERTSRRRFLAGPRRSADRFVAGVTEGKAAVRKRKEFNEVRDTLTKGLMNYGADGEAMIVALHKYEKEEMTLKDLRDHWKRAIAEVDTKNQKEMDRQFKLYMRKLRAANRYKKSGTGRVKGKISEKEWSRGLLAVAENRPNAMEDQMENLTHFIPQARKWEEDRKKNYIKNVSDAFMAGHRAKSKEDAIRIGRALLNKEIARTTSLLAAKGPGRLRGKERKAVEEERGGYVKSRGLFLASVSDPDFLVPTIPGEAPAAPSPVGPKSDLSGATPEELGALQSLPRTTTPAPVRQAPAQLAPPAPVAAKPKAAADRIGRIRPEGLSMRGMSLVQDAIQGAGGGAVSRRKRNMAKTLVGLATRDDREINEDTVVRHYEQWGLDSALLTQEVDKTGRPTGRRTVGRIAEAANSLRGMIKKLKAIEEKDRNAKIKMTNGKPIEVWRVLKFIESGDEVKVLKALQSISVGR
tara:strand:- start:13260 stop:15377 length:2118 start_codon:yes stop_codon:yes gene_type:complete